MRDPLGPVQPYDNDPALSVPTSTSITLCVHMIQVVARVLANCSYYARARGGLPIGLGSRAARVLVLVAHECARGYSRLFRNCFDYVVPRRGFQVRLVSRGFHAHQEDILVLHTNRSRYPVLKHTSSRSSTKLRVLNKRVHTPLFCQEPDDG